MNKKKAAYILGGVMALAILIIGAMSLIEGRFIFSPEVKIEVNGEKTVKLEVLSDYEEAGATAWAGDKDCTADIVTEGTVDTNKIGEYTINYSVTQGKKVYSADRTVIVADTTAPKLTLKGETEMTVSSRELYDEPGYKAVDAFDGKLTKQVSVQEKQDGDVYTLTYTVKDSSGNEGKAVRTLTIKDIVAPTIELEGSQHAFLNVGEAYIESGYTAQDDLDGDVTDAVNVTGQVNTEKEGEYVLTYTVSDQAGNTETAERKVTVYGNNTGSEKRLFLTFDDGPSYDVTPHILDILKKNNVKATFFILNYSDANKDVIARAIREGHTVGIHGYSHDYATIYANDEAFMQNVYRLHDRLQKDFGYDARLVRFPGGSSNTISCDYCKGIMTRLAKRLEKEGYVYFDWNIDSGDANGNMIPWESIYENVTDSLFGKGNNVVLMHDTSYKDTTADALEKIVRYARAKGYELLPLTVDIKPCHHGIAN